MVDETQALQLIYAAVDEVNGQLPPEGRLEKSPATVLSGDASLLDSLTFVNLLVAIEDRVSRAGGASVGLLDEVGRTDDETPLRTLGTVAAFVAEAQKASA
jgi:acyl carrier protein